MTQLIRGRRRTLWRPVVGFASVLGGIAVVALGAVGAQDEFAPDLLLLGLGIVALGALMGAASAASWAWGPLATTVRLEDDMLIVERRGHVVRAWPRSRIRSVGWEGRFGWYECLLVAGSGADFPRLVVRDGAVHRSGPVLLWADEVEEADRLLQGWFRRNA